MNRHEINRTRTISDIKESFIKLYQKNGIDKVSIKEICENANVSKTIFYRYFDDKYQVLEVIENELLEEIKSINMDLIHETIRDSNNGEPLMAFFKTATFIYSKKAYFKPLLGKNGDPGFIYKWNRQLYADIKGKIEYEKVNICDTNAITAMIASAIIGLYKYWFFENSSLTCKEIAEIGTSMLLGKIISYTE